MLFCHNPTRFPRTRWVALGSPKLTANDLALGVLPRSFFKAARIRVQPWSTGAAEIVEAPADFLTEATKFTLGNALFRPVLRLEHDEILTLKPSQSVFDFPFFKRLLWEGHTPDTHAFLWTDLGAGDSVMPFELRVYNEDLNIGQRKRSIWFGNELLPHQSFCQAHTWFAPDGWLAKDLMMGDGQGLAFRGSFMFFHREQDLATLAAELVYPLDGLEEWPNFGAWLAAMQPWSEDDFNEMLAKIIHQPYHDLLANCGALQNSQSARTGEADGFGFQGMVYPGMVANPARGCRGLFPASLQAGRAACRPIHFFNRDGKWLVPSPDFVPWSERAHHDDVVCPNRLERNDASDLFNPIVREWTGSDREHDSASHIYEDAIVRASSASQFELQWKAEHWMAGRTLPSERPGWSTNGAGTGRSVGRGLLAACQEYLGTGNRQLLMRIRKVIAETVLPVLINAGQDGYMAYTILVGHGNVFNGRPGHIVWEDALLVPGLDIAEKLIREDLADATLADELERKMVMLASSLVLNCYFPNSSFSHLAYMILWRDGQKPTDDDFANPEVIVPSIPGTAVTKWSQGLLEVTAKKGTPEAQARAKSLLSTMGNNSWYFKRYEGVE